MKLITKLVIALDIFVIFCFLFVYGPIEYAKNFWITTAMETGTHKYLAYIFYSEDTISEVMSKNSLETIKEETDISTITIGKHEKKTVYESVYEQQILEHDDEDLYKLIEFKYGDFDCYLIAIYDPTRIEAVVASTTGGGKILSDISKEHDAILAINGGGYSWANGKPTGLIVNNSELVYASGYGTFLTGAFNEDGILFVGNMSASEVKEKKIKEALSFGPALIVNGRAAAIQGTGGSGMNPRTVVAQRQDGIALFLVVNGYGQKLSWKGRGGVYYSDLITILERYGAYNAVNMDGGSSTTLVINHELINSPCEPQKEGQDFIRTAWILK
jgi:exopolysaccharide biosynthesis protein